MTFEQLESLIEGMEVGDEYTIKTSSLMYGLKCMELLGSVVIIFGGYGSHYITLDTDTTSDSEIASEIEKYVGEYLSEIEGKERITIDEFQLV